MEGNTSTYLPPDENALTTSERLYEDECFRSATTGALIDYVTFETSSNSRCVPKSLGGTLKRHAGGFTVHDPTASDLLGLARCKLIRAEISIDLAPKPDVQESDRPRELAAIFRFMATRVWPFDCIGVAKRYGAAMERGAGYIPYAFDEEGDATDPRMPVKGEVLYVGHAHHYRWRRNRWAQVRMYWKTEDQGEPLALRKQVIRIEVTIDRGGLRPLRLINSASLKGYKYRKNLSSCFRMLNPESASLAAARARERAGDNSLVPWIAKVAPSARAERRNILRRLVLEGGLLPLMHNKFAQVNSLDGDVAANKKLGVALDNLTKWSTRSVGGTRLSIPVSS